MISYVNDDLEQAKSVCGVSTINDDMSSAYDEGTTSRGEDDDDSTSMGDATNVGNFNKGAAPPRRQLAAKEVQTVRRIKYFVICFLFIITIAVAFGAFFASWKSEGDEFISQFNEDATKIVQTMGRNLVLTLQASDAFTVSITSMAMATNQSWPYVVVPDFAVRAEKIRSLANSVYVNTYIWVEPDERSAWQNFTALTGPAWVDESIEAIAEFDGMDWPIVRDPILWDVIYDYDEYEKEEDNQGLIGVDTQGPWLPMWQTQPLIAYEPPYNWDLNSVPNTSTMKTTAQETIKRTHKAVITEAYLISYPEDKDRIEEDLLDAQWITSYLAKGEVAMEPISDIFYPIVSNANQHIEIDHDGIDGKGNDVVGIFSIAIYWRDTIRNILPMGNHGLIAVFKNPCNPTFTYKINGPDVIFLGAGDLHDPQYDHMVKNKYMSELSDEAMTESSYSGIQIDDEFCPFHISVYPSQQTENNHRTLTPFYFSLVTVIIFAVTAATFVIYDFWVERRQQVVMKTAVTTTALVSSLFPDVVMDRMISTGGGGDDSTSTSGHGSQPNTRLKSFLNDGKEDDVVAGAAAVGEGNQSKKFSKPIAELFPDTTVFFGDIAGFTAWSSVREPSHVFTLLETLYGSFDKIAKQYGIFKVETIGDSYVAVCGLPEPRENHAVAMARFAFECIKKMKEKTQELELVLGPGTADLCLRIGFHSGPTIAGVLRGEKARFQLFGDTVNTASRMESTSQPNRIQVSQKTAGLIIASGKKNWLTAREDLVLAKGKGTLQTYWLERKKGASRTASTVSSIADSRISEIDNPSPSLRRNNSPIDPKIQRLIDWNVAIFTDLLEGIATHRATAPKVLSKRNVVETMSKEGQHVRDEVVETINMRHNAIATQSGKKIKLDSKVITQLRNYITQIASFYHGDNGFHNFQHASHVTMCTLKLLSRVATQDCVTEEEYFKSTYGISSDPLTKFAIVFSALIHDVDHQGVTNFQLAKEKNPMALTYENKSVLEQHSVDLAWSLLTESSFEDLRECIYATQEEYNHFRQLSVNCVMATDIFDKELKSFRDSRWEKCFKPSNEEISTSSPNNEDWNRKATIVIECIIQASDVAHTMQHWHVYQRWNKCLFNEMYTAYKTDRSDKDPALGWYEGELWFFDNYIIPLATKLQECEVFGVSCDEFLDFAKENRREWSVKGRDIVAQMLEDIKNKEGKIVEGKSEYNKNSGFM